MLIFQSSNFLGSKLLWFYISEYKLNELHFYDFPVLEKTIYPISSVNRQVHGGDSPAKIKIYEAKKKFTAHVHFTHAYCRPIFLYPVLFAYQGCIVREINLGS